MNEKQKTRARSDWLVTPVRAGSWTLSRIEILSTVKPGKWPVARVDLQHDRRGHVFGIATGAGGLDAALNAVADIFGKDADVIHLATHLRPSPEPARTLVSLRVRVEGEDHESEAVGGDLIIAAITAMLKVMDSIVPDGGRPSSVSPCSACLETLAGPAT